MTFDVMVVRLISRRCSRIFRGRQLAHNSSSLVLDATPEDDHALQMRQHTPMRVQSVTVVVRT